MFSCVCSFLFFLHHLAGYFLHMHCPQAKNKHSSGKRHQCDRALGIFVCLLACFFDDDDNDDDDDFNSLQKQ